MSLLEIKNLSVVAGGREIVKEVSFDVRRGSVTALVGGSGSGKTTIGLAILGLLPAALRTTSGKVLFSDHGDPAIELVSANHDVLRSVRGKRIGMVFQEPLYAFDPLYTIGAQIDESLCFHGKTSVSFRRERVLEILAFAGLPDPKRAAGAYPHELSGGMRQRAMIAQALVCEPALIIADEPTSNLDVTLQAKIIELFRSLRVKFGLSILLITHDLGMVSHLADDVVVLEQGKVVEKGAAKDVLGEPQHEYTRELLNASG